MAQKIAGVVITSTLIYKVEEPINEQYEAWDAIIGSLRRLVFESTNQKSVSF